MEKPYNIVSHLVNKSGIIVYLYKKVNEEDVLVRNHMPFARVQRVHGRRNGSREVHIPFESEMSTSSSIDTS